MSSSALPLSSLYHSCLWDIQVRYEVDADINEGIFKTKVLLMLLWIFIMLLIAAKYQTCTCACVQCTCTRYLSLPTRYPWHASCKLQWTFTSLSCSQVQLSSNKKTKLMKSAQVGEKLERQMSAWEGDSNCGVTSSSCPELPCGQVMLPTHHQHHHQSTAPSTAPS